MVQDSTKNRPVFRSKVIELLVAATLLFLTLCFSSPCSSQERHTVGVGGDSCVSYVSQATTSPGKLVGRSALDERQDFQSTVYREWLLGFISGYNTTLKSPTERVQVDAAAVDRYVRWWCGQNRASNISTAVQRFLDGDVP